MNFQPVIVPLRRPPDYNPTNAGVRMGATVKPKKKRKGLRSNFDGTDVAGAARPRDCRREAKPQVEKLPDPIDPQCISTDLIYRREVHHAAAMAARCQRWLAERFAAGRVPADEVARLILVVSLYVECWLLAPIAWPELFPADPEAEDPDEDEPPVESYCELTVRDGDAFVHGLTIRRRPMRRPKTRPTMPGCAGNAGLCTNLRAFGERFCPVCRRSEKARIKALQGAG